MIEQRLKLTQLQKLLFNLKSWFKLVRVFFWVGIFFVVLTPLYPFYKFYPYKMRQLIIPFVSFLMRRVMSVFGIKISIKGLFDPNENYLVVSNHLSYFDMFVLNQLTPMCFVTSLEMKHAPFIGPITQLYGTLYVDRRSRENIHNEVKDISQALSFGLNVGIFPEATSTNAEELLPFKRSLYQSALDSGRKVLPVAINYLRINGQKLSRTNRDLICWYGDMELVPHLLELSKQSSVEVELVVGEPLDAQGHHDTKQIRDQSREVVARLFKPLNS